MVRYRQIAFAILFTVLLYQLSNVCLGENSLTIKTDSGHTLELTTTGEIRLYGGRRGAFRIYKAPDSTEGSLVFGQFRSVEDAQYQVDEWLKSPYKVRSKTREKDQSGRSIGKRIVATQKDKSGINRFLIIRRSDGKCWLITANSLSTAKDIEELTK